MTEAYLKSIQQARLIINEADYIIIGAGAGLSDAAGLKYSGKRFTENFQPFIKRYGITDMYSAGFYPFISQEEKWGYWAKHIQMNRYGEPATQLYRDLLQLIFHKNYFVITTNVDYQFYKAGFDAKRIFAVQGDYGMLQCEKGCHNTLYPNESLIKQMGENSFDCKTSLELVPLCPVCGGTMDINIRKNSFFIEDDNWHKADNRYNNFLHKALKGKLVFLEMGVGFNTPGIIRYPFEQLTLKYKNISLIRFNKQHAFGIDEIKNKTILFQDDIAQTIKMLIKSEFL